MYTGNGVTKKFPLPAGYDGSAVYLIFPTGRSIQAIQGESYTVSDGAVYFYAAVPAGIVVSFEEPEDVTSASGTLSYVIIYSDGRIVEVTEDPAELLAQTQKVLSDAKTHYAEVMTYAEQTTTQMRELKAALSNELEALLNEYVQRGRELVIENAELHKSRIQAELDGALLRLQAEEQKAKSELQVVEQFKREIQTIAGSAAEDASQQVESKCSEAIEACETVERLKSDCEYYRDEAKSAAQKSALETQYVLSLKVNESLEMLRSLRTKLEADSESMNARFNSVWEILRGEINGR